MSSEETLPSIPAKRYFTIGEVGQLCGVKPHVLRYWEQEFSQLRPMKRRGNRRYYQHHEVLMIRRIRELLYDQGFTISGARNKMLDSQSREGGDGTVGASDIAFEEVPPTFVPREPNSGVSWDRLTAAFPLTSNSPKIPAVNAYEVVTELKELLRLLTLDEKYPD